jgi:hypothetical protein
MISLIHIKELRNEKQTHKKIKPQKPTNNNKTRWEKKENKRICKNG